MPTFDENPADERIRQDMEALRARPACKERERPVQVNAPVTQPMCVGAFREIEVGGPMYATPNDASRKQAVCHPITKASGQRIVTSSVP
jgi:hypothetical protein